MGAKDRKANEYFADNRRFADMCNAVLFGGRNEFPYSEPRRQKYGCGGAHSW